jgi:signal transduction histidine kinase
VGEILEMAAAVGAGEADRTERLLTVLGELTRTLSASASSTRAKTKAAKSIKQLGRELAARAEQVGADGKQVATAAGEMADEIALEAMARSYVEKRRRLEKTGRTLARKLERPDNPARRERLAWLLEQAGLDAGELVHLLGQGGERPPDELANWMRDAIPPPTPGGADPAPVIHDTVISVAAELEARLRHSGEVLNVIAGALREMEEAPAKRPARDGEQLREGAAQKLRTSLAELGQEICQPLAVLMATLDILMSERAGPIGDSQRELLDMARSAAVRTEQLARYLLSIAGSPEGRQPDEVVVSSLYQR